jgi:GT2 family glycosyltransferase
MSAEIAMKKFAVVIASKGRPSILAETVRSLGNQTMPIDDVFLAVTSSDDIEDDYATRPEVTVLYCRPGLTRQRNAAIDATIDQFEYVVFLDDDMHLHPDYIAAAVRFLDDQPTIVAFSGLLLRNGDITRLEADRVVRSATIDANDYRPMFRCQGSYWTMHGCNMVVRSSVLRYEKFDENLPLYGFAEDYDISLRVSQYGRVGRFRGCLAVHLQTPSGRISEARLGYAMLANNWYFLRKKLTHCPTLWIGYLWFAIRLGLFEPIRNAWAATVRHVPGRSGRLYGNLLALRDILIGNCSPQRVEEMKS